MTEGEPKRTVSDMFKDVFADCGGSVRLTCACGITHYNPYDASCFDRGELESLEAAAKKDPKKYMAHDHTIGTYVVAGQAFVWDCPCEGGLKYENFIKAYRHNIAEYLNKLADALAEDSRKTRVGKDN